MSHKLKHLIKHQHKLQAKAALQRQELSANISAWHGRLRWVDRGFAAVNYVRHHPTTVLSAGALLAFFTPFKSGRTLFGAWAAFKALRNIGGLFSSKQ